MEVSFRSDGAEVLAFASDTDPETRHSRTGSMMTNARWIGRALPAFQCRRVQV
jgi:hypothetical protein